jgi:ribose transport system permease protein
VGPRFDRSLQVLLWVLRAGPALILGLLVVVMSFASPVFLASRNIGNVLAQTAVIAVLAMGQLLVIVTRGIDLSVGATLALSAVVGAQIFQSIDSGLLVVLSLATLTIVRGLALWVSDGRPIQGMPPIVQTLGGDSVAEWLPVSWFVVGGLALAMAALTTRLVWGRWIYAVGGNPEAARRTAIPVPAVLISVYVLCGLLAGIAGVLTAGRTNAGAPTFGELAELDSIAAVIIGGASFLGGRGHVGNALVGALMIGVIRNAMNLANLDSYFRLIVLGLVILAAVEMDVVRGRIEAKVRVLQAARS